MGELLSDHSDSQFDGFWEGADQDHRKTRRQVIAGTIVAVTSAVVLTFGVQSCTEALIDETEQLRQRNVESCIGHLRNLPPPIPDQYEDAVMNSDPGRIEITMQQACDQANGNSIQAIGFWATALNSTSTTQQS